MRLRAWVKLEGKGAISRLAEATGLAYSTVHAHVYEKRVPEGRTALKISAATSGAVSVDELFEPFDDSAPPPRRRRSAPLRARAA